ncbi:MAG: hypothetical protein DRO11_01490 [Methanobacteriota archaeon]|nr:MAG: hypothetical protein DRO11_01490 [Euryarchaeota archaeon]
MLEAHLDPSTKKLVPRTMEEIARYVGPENARNFVNYFMQIGLVSGLSEGDGERYVWNVPEAEQAVGPPDVAKHAAIEERRLEPETYEKAESPLDVPVLSYDGRYKEKYEALSDGAARVAAYKAHTVKNEHKEEFAKEFRRLGNEIQAALNYVIEDDTRVGVPNAFNRLTYVIQNILDGSARATLPLIKRTSVKTERDRVYIQYFPTNQKVARKLEINLKTGRVRSY